MAQHYNIKAWKKEKWYPKLMRRIKHILKCTAGNQSYGNNFVKFYKRLEILSSEYKMDLGENLILDYRPRLTDQLDKDEWLRLCDCGIEIHSRSRGFSQNKLLEVYLVA